MVAEAVDEQLQCGEGFWVKAANSGTITLLGEVVATNITLRLSTGYNIVANPYPCDLKITNFGRLDDSFAGYDDNYDFTTTMEVWNGSGYSFYGWAGTSGTDVDDDDSLDYTWTDLVAEPVDGSIPAGSSVWIKAAHAGTITFAAPNLK